MNYLPISGIVLRHLRFIKNYILGKFLFTFYWPVLDILIWGFFGNWLNTIQGDDNLKVMLLLAILLWSSFGRIGNEIFISLLEELWTHNIINIFASPIKLSEWILGVLSFTCIIFLVLMPTLVIFTSFIYNISILMLFKNFIIFSPLLLMSAMVMGFLALSIIISFGLRVNEVGWVLMWFFMPFSGVFYPIDSLPIWAQKISTYLPMSYVFTGMRKYVLHQTNPLPFLIKSFILNLIYGTLFLALFFYAFNRSKNKGLSRLTD